MDVLRRSTTGIGNLDHDESAPVDRAGLFWRCFFQDKNVSFDFSGILSFFGKAVRADRRDRHRKQKPNYITLHTASLEYKHQTGTPESAFAITDTHQLSIARPILCLLRSFVFDKLRQQACRGELAAEVQAAAQAHGA